MMYVCGEGLEMPPPESKKKIIMWLQESKAIRRVLLSG